MKKILSKIVIFVAGIMLYNATSAQDSSRIRISLLTCTPGDELYSTFGHSAIRIMDSSSVQVIDSVSLRDAVFNYGTFDFNDPDFYPKFIRGKLLYCLSIDTYDGFSYEYQMTNRGITEQVLNLSAAEKKSIIAALIENYKPGNRYYKYDFFLDNCTTRLRDLIAKNKDPRPQLPPVMPVKFRFRQAIHQYLDLNKKDWSKLGIDILLGAPCDAVMTTEQQEFLPDNLMIALDSTKNTSMVLASQNLYQLNPQQNTSSWFTPMICFLIVLFLFIAISFANKKLRVLLNVLDGLLFFFTGALGLLLLFMWFGTDHSMTKTNYNLLWALPPHIIIAFFMNSKKRWVKKYFLVTAVIMVLLLISCFFLPQEMNNALLPLVILLLFRAGVRSQNKEIFKK